jgi:hypothetical protein
MVERRSPVSADRDTAESPELRDTLVVAVNATTPA